MNVIFYSSHCPRCHVLETKLKQKNISYTECNDIDVMVSKGLTNAPALEVDGVIMEFSEAVKWVKEQ